MLRPASGIGFRSTGHARLPAGRRSLCNGAGPALLSKTYLPTTKATTRRNDDGLRSAQLLQQAGFIRQSSAGIFSFLPFGQRVIEKIESIVEEEMLAIGMSPFQAEYYRQASLTGMH